jgi:hypothetical protein
VVDTGPGEDGKPKFVFRGEAKPADVPDVPLEDVTTAETTD